MSVFLIVVVLLGVFFSMGYIVGRSSPPATIATADPSAHSANPIVVENAKASTPTEAPSERAAAPPLENKPSPLSPGENAPASKKEKIVEPAGKPVIGEPAAGQTFLQVVATTRPDSELIAETLAKKGFHIRVAPGPNPALFRVLVGPLDDAADVAETRVRLESAGFKNPYVRKY